MIVNERYEDYNCLFFFFFKQKTAYEIYQCDWSSDVCSSDLIADYVADIRAPTPSAAAEIVSKSSKEISTELAHFNSRLTSSFLSKISVLKGKLGYEISLLKNPVKKLAEQRLRIDELLWRAEKIMDGKIVNLRFSLRGMSGKLNSLSPLAILERGYSITTSIHSGQVIKTKNQVKAGDLLNIKLHKGQLVCVVKK